MNLRRLRWALWAYVCFDLFFGGICGGFLPLSPLAAAQFTTVSGTVTDPNGLPYANGTISASLVSSGSPTLGGLPYTPPTQPVGLSSAGSFVMLLADNTQLSPGGSTWSFTVSCAAGCVPVAGGKGPVSFTVTGVTISGASQSITATLTAAAPALSFSGGGSSTPPFGNVTAGNNTNPLTVGTGGSFTPAQTTIPIPTGQITATGEWIPAVPAAIFPPSPTLTINATGGTLVNQTTLYVRLTYVGLSTAFPSGEVRAFIPVATCTGGNQCSITVNMPTQCQAGSLPTGATGCTVWDDIAGINLEQQQAASNNCVNITTATCVIGTNAAGSSLVFPTTSGLVPPNAQTNNCPDKVIPFAWIQKEDLNYYPLWGVDTTSINSGQPAGYLTLCDHLYVNDKVQPAQITNALVSIDHGTGIGINNVCVSCADFGLGVENIDVDSNSRSFTQSLTQYNERIWQNPFLTCTPAGGETCGAGGRFNFTDNRTSGTINPGGTGFNGIAGIAFNVMGSSHGTTGGSAPYKGVAAEAEDATNAVYNEGGIAYVGLAAQSTYLGSGTASSGYDIQVLKGGNFPQGNTGLQIQGYTNARNFDYAINVQGGYIYLGGVAEAPISEDNWTTNHGTITGVGSISETGDLGTVAFVPNATIGPISQGGTGGATTWTYNAACVGSDGTVSVYTTPRSTTTGNANLTATNNNQLVSQPPIGCTSVAWYRTASGGTCNSGACGTGFIGTTAVPLWVSIAAQAAGTVSFTDTGIVATGGTTSPAGNYNNTGSLALVGYESSLNTVRVGPSGFTTANNTSLQTITGLTWSLYNTAALNVSFACDLAYSQATGNAAVAFGIQAATNNPTNIFATGTQQITVGPPATFVTGTLATLATTTATNIVSGTPTALATNYTVHLAGTIELPANTYDVINIMTSTATGTDPVTVLRGSACYQTP
jgi:hypothetical protein